MESPKEKIKEDMSEEKLAEQLLGKIENIVKGEKVELALIDELQKAQNELLKLSQEANGTGLSEVRKAVQKADSSFTNLLRAAENAIEISDKYISSAKELGVDSKEAQKIKSLANTLENDAEYWIKELNASQYN